MNIEFPFFPESPATKLDGLWNFKWLGDNIPETINTIEYDEKGAVPGVFDLSPLHVNEKGVAAVVQLHLWFCINLFYCQLSYQGKQMH